MKIFISSMVDLKKSFHNSRLHQLLKYLSDRHEITVLSINDWWKSGIDPGWTNYCRDFDNLFDKIEYIYLTEKRINPILQDLTSIINIQKFKINLFKNDYDVHFCYNCLLFGYIITKHFKSKNIGTLYDIADDIPEMARTSMQIPPIMRPIAGSISNLIFKKNIHLANKISCTAKSLIDSYEIPLNKSVIIPNGVDPDLFKNYSSENLRIKLGLENYFVLGHVGVLREWLDFNPIFKALKLLTNSMDIKMLIVGGGPRFNETIELAKKYDVSTSIYFTGTIPYSQLPYYISCMDVGIIPFRRYAVSENSLPLKLFEYMACEKPVISTEISAIHDSLGNAILYGSNSDELVNQIRELYFKEDFRIQLGKNGRRLVIDDFSWEKISERLELLIRELKASP